MGFIENVNNLAQIDSDISNVSQNMVGLQEINDNLPEILLADDNAAIATAKAAEALQSKTDSYNYAVLSEQSSQSSDASKQAAATSEQNASTSEQAALASKNAAATSEQNASSSEQAALGSKNAAATSEQNANTSEQAALASKNLADKFANEAENTEVEPGKYSAFHWSEKAKAFASGSADAIGVTDVTNESGDVIVTDNVQVSLAAISAVIDEQAAALGNEIWVNAQNIQQLKLT